MASTGKSARRVTTGIAGLDVVLQGGLIEGGLYLILGEPGTGKTVLASQLCSHRAAAGERAVFTTVLTESHSRMLENLRSFTFFDEAVISRQVTLLSGFSALEKEGPEGLRDLLQRAIHKTRASVLVLDSLATLADVATSRLRFKRFLRELATFCEISGCTCLLLTALPNADATAEAGLADGVFRLSRHLRGMRDLRQLEVVKFRGSNHLSGQHAFTIDEAGITVYPRTEALLAGAMPRLEQARGRVAFGISRLDEMLRGGVLSASTTGLMGSPGAGKTLLGLQFLANGAEAGEPGLYFGLYESPARLIGNAESIGIPLGHYVKSGAVELLWVPALEFNLDMLVARLLAAVTRLGARRLFIDGINGFVQGAFAPERISIVFTALAYRLRELGVTTLISEETTFFGAELPSSALLLSASCENLLHLRYQERRSRLYRLLSILKVRESDYDPSLRELRISSSGMEVAGAIGSSGPLRPKPPQRAAPRKPPSGKRGKS